MKTKAKPYQDETHEKGQEGPGDKNWMDTFLLPRLSLH